MKSSGDVHQQVDKDVIGNARLIEHNQNNDLEEGVSARLVKMMRQTSITRQKRILKQTGSSKRSRLF